MKGLYIVFIGRRSRFMRREFLWSLVALLGLDVVVFLLAPIGGSQWMGSFLIGLALAATIVVSTLVQFWDYLRPLPTRAERTSPGEKSYLQGRLEAFDQAEIAFTALAGDAAIEPRFE